MESLLQNLYEGKLAPIEQFEPILKEYKKKWEESLSHDDCFCKKLDPAQQIEFEKLIDEHHNLFPLELSQVFIDGFRLDAQLALVTFCNIQIEKIVILIFYFYSHGY